MSTATAGTTATTSTSPAGNHRSTTALILAAVSTAGGLGCMAWLTSLLNAARGCDSHCRPVLQDPSQPHETLMHVLLGSQLLWTVLGITALVLGIRALDERGGLVRSILAIVLAVATPLAVIALFWHAFA